jgi:ribosome-associated protein
LTKARRLRRASPLQSRPNRRRRFVIATSKPESTESKEAVKHPTAARQFAIDAARLASQSRCKDVVVLDVSGISPITDYFVIATGTSARQMTSVCEDIEELGEPRSFKALHQSGLEATTWAVQDFVDVVVHIFTPEARSFYDLDGLWGDATKIDWQTN